MSYETELRNKNRGYIKLIVWQKAMELFELVWVNLGRCAARDSIVR